MKAKQEYKVTGILEVIPTMPDVLDIASINRRSYVLKAETLKTRYGLPHSLEVIARIWELYSMAYYDMGWAEDSKSTIEKAFDVQLKSVWED